MQELYNIISEELMKKFDNDKARVDEFLSKIGEAVLMDVVSDIMEGASEEQREILQPVLNEGEMGKFLEKAKELKFDLEEIFERNSKIVMKEILG